MTSPTNFLQIVLQPGLAFMRNVLPDDRAAASNDCATVLLLAIAGQESNWEARRQIGGPARSYWQFERGGGVRGVLTHASAQPRMRSVCAALNVPMDEATVYEAIAWNDILATCAARLLLWTDPPALPALGDEEGAWACYVRTWRPGKPDRTRWTERYASALHAMPATNPA